MRGRPRLRHDTPHTGSDVSGRHILVGGFSPEAREDYLSRRLSRNGHPLIDEPVCRIIAERSHGLPLYLDLSVMRCLEMRRSSRQPQAPSVLAIEITLPGQPMNSGPAPS